ncbi:MAG: hypothetical protein ACM3KR_06240 [Deltaproteobacteria bacterium]
MPYQGETPSPGGYFLTLEQSFILSDVILNDSKKAIISTSFDKESNEHADAYFTLNKINGKWQISNISNKISFINMTKMNEYAQKYKKNNKNDILKNIIDNIDSYKNKEVEKYFVATCDLDGNKVNEIFFIYNRMIEDKKVGFFTLIKWEGNSLVCLDEQQVFDGNETGRSDKYLYLSWKNVKVQIEDIIYGGNKEICIFDEDDSMRCLKIFQLINDAFVELDYKLSTEPFYMDIEHDKTGKAIIVNTYKVTDDKYETTCYKWTNEEEFKEIETTSLHNEDGR